MRFKTWIISKDNIERPLVAFTSLLGNWHPEEHKPSVNN